MSSGKGSPPKVPPRNRWAPAPSCPRRAELHLGVVVAVGGVGGGTRRRQRDAAHRHRRRARRRVIGLPSAGVARRREGQGAALAGLRHRVAHGLRFRGGDALAAEAEVEHLGGVGVGVDLLAELDRQPGGVAHGVDDVGEVGVALGVEHPDRQHLDRRLVAGAHHARRAAPRAARRVLTPAGHDDAGDVGAVALGLAPGKARVGGVTVGTVAVAVVGAAQHVQRSFLRRPQLPGEVGVVVAHARVGHRHRDRPGVPARVHVAPHRAVAHQRKGPLQRGVLVVRHHWGGRLRCRRGRQRVQDHVGRDREHGGVGGQPGLGLRHVAQAAKNHAALAERLALGGGDSQRVERGPRLPRFGGEGRLGAHPDRQHRVPVRGAAVGHDQAAHFALGAGVGV